MAGQGEVQEVTGGSGSGAPSLLGSQGFYPGASTSRFQGSDCPACAGIHLTLEIQTPASISALNIFELPGSEEYNGGARKLGFFPFWRREA